jgi:hypothetical protein
MNGGGANTDITVLTLLNSYCLLIHFSLLLHGNSTTGISSFCVLGKKCIVTVIYMSFLLIEL